ncbi:survival protein SurA precursor [Photobacterium aphoticum]|uniref:Survival protein SurA n=1 Tax=Photobacterium aphoticum TaxID=754436 RepID=A0A090QXI2_9GAMM|nr:survival protein SurA precursor [Photobacterium aphoticum]
MKNWKSSLLGLALLGLSAGTIAAPQELDRVVTIVNDSVILQSDVDAMMKTVRMNAAGQSQPLPPDSVLSQQVMDQLIMETLQLQQAKQFGIRVDDTRLDQAIAQIAKERKMTLPQLQQLLARNGISYAMFREQVRRDITASEARTIQVRRRINILPQEVETLANQLSQQEQQGVRYNISHIQLRLEDGATAQEREKVADEAKELVKELKKGADFANLAYSYSKGPKACRAVNGVGCAKKKCQPSLPIKLPHKAKAPSSGLSAVVWATTF